MNIAVRNLGVAIAFLLLAILLIGNAFVTRTQLAIQTGRQAWVVHSREVELEIEHTQNLLEDAESGQRGYLYTGDPTYLAPYKQALEQWNKQIEDLTRLTADNPRQAANVVELRDLASRKFDEMARTIALSNAGKLDQASSVVLTGHGLELMQQLHRIIGRMEQEEAALEDLRDEAYEQSVERTVRSIYLASSVAIIGLAIVAHFILRERRLRERHAHDLRAREEWFRVTLNSIGDAVIATDGEGNVTFLNPMAQQLTGSQLENVAGKSLREVFPIFNEMTGETAEDPVQKVLSLGIVVGLANHTVLRHQNGTMIPIEDSAAPIRDDRGQTIGVILVFRDASGERQSQELVRKAEKLATAARLSATVAHEINNPLEAVINLVFLAKQSPGIAPEVVQQLSLAEQELDRVSHITRQTLGFYRESNNPGKIEVAPLIDAVLKLYTNKLRAKDIQAQCNSADCPAVFGSPGELKQIIANLVTNAIDAVGPQGRVSITCRTVNAHDGRPHLEIAVEDDGPGVSPEHAARIFEPFFTTKKDVGTGLGLWVAKEIAERLDGTLTLGPPSGTTAGAAFILKLPLAN
jgi:PAS domain S-box-containing protein